MSVSFERRIFLYLILFGLIIYSFFVSVITQKTSTISGIIGVIILAFYTLFMGLRYGVGLDYFNYLDSYGYDYNAYGFEPFFYFLMYFCKNYLENFYYVTLFTLMISNIFIYLGLKKRNIEGFYFLLAIFIFLSNTAMVYMNIMRQGIAVSICFYAVTFIYEKNFKRYLFFIILAMGFHLSAIFMLPFYFIRVKFNKITFLIAVILCYVAAYFQLATVLINVVASIIPKYNYFQNSTFLQNDSVKLLSLGVLLNVVVMLCLLFSKKKNKQIEDIDTNLYLIGILFNVLSLSTFVFDRIGIYFFIFGISTIPKFLNNLKRVELRILLSMLVFVGVMIYFSQQYLLIDEDNYNYYHSIFESR